MTEARIGSLCRLSQKLFPNTTKEISRVFMHVLPVNGAEGLLNYPYAFKITHGNVNRTSTKD